MLDEKTFDALPDEVKRKIFALLEAHVPQAKEKKKSKTHIPLEVRYKAIERTHTFSHLLTKEEILAHTFETLIPSLSVMSQPALKAAAVELIESIALLEEVELERTRWRNKAAKIIMIDAVDGLQNAIISLATGIRENRFKR